MSEFRKLSQSMFASPQIAIADLDEAKALGVTLVVCNRPDDEEPGQLNSSEVEAAAKERGMDFVAIPITHSGFSEPQIAALGEALGKAEGNVLGYCRSGTRSTLLWSLTRSAQGADPEAIASAAAAAGYDVSPIRPAMDMLAAKANG